MIPITVPYRTSSQIVRVAAASGLAQEFLIGLQPKVKIKNNTSSVYLPLYSTVIRHTETRRYNLLYSTVHNAMLDSYFCEFLCINGKNLIKLKKPNS